MVSEPLVAGYLKKRSLVKGFLFFLCFVPFLIFSKGEKIEWIGRWLGAEVGNLFFWCFSTKLFYSKKIILYISHLSSPVKRATSQIGNTTATLQTALQNTVSLSHSISWPPISRRRRVFHRHRQASTISHAKIFCKSILSPLSFL